MKLSMEDNSAGRQILKVLKGSAVLDDGLRLDPMDWEIVCSGFLRGEKAAAIAGDLVKTWDAAGRSNPFEGWGELVAVIGWIEKDFSAQRGVMKRFLQQPLGDAGILMRSMRLHLIDKYVRILDASITAKLAAGLDPGEHCEKEMRLLARFLERAHRES